MTENISREVLTPEFCTALPHGKYTDRTTCQLLSSDGYRVFLPILGAVFGIAAVVLNSLVASFFSAKTDQVMHLIYFCLACSDMVTGLVAIYQGAAVVLSEWFFPVARLQLYSIFYVLGQLPFHVSAFINLQLSVARTTSLLFPLHAVRRESIKMGILIYTFIWAALIVAEWIVAYHVAGFLKTFWRTIPAILYVYPRPGGLLVDEIFFRAMSIEAYENAVMIRKVLVTLLSTFIPYGLPSIICLLSAILQLRQIFKNNAKHTREKSRHRNRKMSITIILLTTVFFICNTAYLIAMISDMVYHLEHSANYKHKFILLIASNHLLYLNSALTPLILILRGSTMKEFTKSRLSVRQKSAHSTKYTGLDRSTCHKSLMSK